MAGKRIEAWRDDPPALSKIGGNKSETSALRMSEILQNYRFPGFRVDHRTGGAGTQCGARAHDFKSQINTGETA
jgi:hypothetical protein